VSLRPLPLARHLRRASRVCPPARSRRAAPAALPLPRRHSCRSRPRLVRQLAPPPSCSEAPLDAGAGDELPDILSSSSSRSSSSHEHTEQPSQHEPADAGSSTARDPHSNGGSHGAAEASSSRGARQETSSSNGAPGHEDGSSGADAWLPSPADLTAALSAAADDLAGPQEQQQQNLGGGVDDLPLQQALATSTADDDSFQDGLQCAVARLKALEDYRALVATFPATGSSGGGAVAEDSLWRGALLIARHAYPLLDEAAAEAELDAMAAEVKALLGDTRWARWRRWWWRRWLWVVAGGGGWWAVVASRRLQQCCCTVPRCARPCSRCAGPCSRCPGGRAAARASHTPHTHTRPAQVPAARGQGHHAGHVRAARLPRQQRRLLQPGQQRR
jgi:hypothetical protein